MAPAGREARSITVPTARQPLRRLRRTELPLATVALAYYLIGKVLVREHADGRTGGRIFETEAYPPGDAAGHAFRGPTGRNRALYLERGHTYVYFVYGSSYMCNVSSELAGIGAGVLLRALEPLDGIDVMMLRRGASRPCDLARGPGRLGAALAVDRRCDRIDLCAAGDLWLAAAPWAPGPISRSVRIGITREVGRPWRFYERGSPAVSGPRQLRA